MNPNSHQYYIFYDGECGFCNYWTQWIMKRDRKNQFIYLSLQSEKGQEFLKQRGLETKAFNTLYLWSPNSFYLVRSEAILKIAKLLGGKYAILARLNIFPTFFNDMVYNEIAKRRKKLLNNTCQLPNSNPSK